VRERVTFLLGKDPELDRGGDVTMFGLLRRVAEERYDTEVICLSAEPARRTPGVTRVPKPAIALPTLAARSLWHRRSLIHTRFDVDAMTEAIDRSDSRRFVAVHAYMCEPYLRSQGSDPSRDLLVSTEVSEAPVWRSRGVAGRLEGRRIARDEWRIARAARAVASYDAAEVAAYRKAGVEHAHWLPLTLPPAVPVDVARTPPRLVMLGNRQWSPNARAAERILAWWPEIAAGVPGAELWLIGARPAGPAIDMPGVVDHGEVDDVATMLASCRAMVAPVSVGGGVRVKVLEAAARGLPVISSPAGVGSVEQLLGLDPVTDEHFVARCRGLLADAGAAAQTGAALHAVNAALWHDRVGRDAVLAWMS
jgi:hypothetical protein